MFLVLLWDRHRVNELRKTRVGLKVRALMLTLNKVNRHCIAKVSPMASMASRREPEEGGHALRDGWIIQGCRERGPRIKRPCTDDPRGSLLADARESADRGERRVVHIERVFDRRERPLTVTRHPHVDESIQRYVVREADKDRIRANLPAVRHVAVVNLQEHVPEDRAFRDYPLQHLVVDQGPHGLLELPEFAIQSRGLELPTHRTDLPDVDPADPEILCQELLQDCEIQVERLLRLAFEAGDEVEPWKEARHSVFAPIATDGVH